MNPIQKLTILDMEARALERIREEHAAIARILLIPVGQLSAFEADFATSMRYRPLGEPLTMRQRITVAEILARNTLVNE